MKIRFCVLSLIIFFSGPACGADLSQSESLFYQGNSYYSAENFDRAVNAYEEALGMGYESGPLYYNLGNAYFRAGVLGKAILNYLRAQRLMPRDADLKANLDYAESLIKGGRTTSGRSGILRIFYDAAGLFSLDRITLFVGVLSFILGISLILVITRKRFKKVFIYISVAGVVFLLFCLSIFFTQIYSFTAHKEAVLIAESVDSRFEPFDDATVFFSLNEGECVEVLCYRDRWVKVRRMDGNQGWIPKSDIELL